MKKYPKHVSDDEFKDRLARIIHGRPRMQRHYSKAVVRQPGDAGYYPPETPFSRLQENDLASAAAMTHLRK